MPFMMVHQQRKISRQENFNLDNTVPKKGATILRTTFLQLNLLQQNVSNNTTQHRRYDINQNPLCLDNNVYPKKKMFGNTLLKVQVRLNKLKEHI